MKHADVEYVVSRFIVISCLDFFIFVESRSNTPPPAQWDYANEMIKVSLCGITLNVSFVCSHIKVSHTLILHVFVRFIQSSLGSETNLSLALMEPVSQKELRKYFALAVVIGLALGIIYTHITSSYSKQFQVSLELLQKLEILGAQPHSKSNATVTEDDFLTIEQEISATVDNDTVLKKIPANATTKNKAQFAMADRNNRKESLEDSMMHKESQGPSSAGNMDGKTMCALDKTKLGT